MAERSNVGSVLIAVAIAAATSSDPSVGLKITGLDVLPRDDGEPFVLEANCFPGYKALMDTTGIQIHEFIVDYFEKLIRG